MFGTLKLHFVGGQVKIESISKQPLSSLTNFFGLAEQVVAEKKGFVHFHYPQECSMESVGSTKKLYGMLLAELGKVENERTMAVMRNFASERQNPGQYGAVDRQKRLETILEKIREHEDEIYFKENTGLDGSLNFDASPQYLLFCRLVGLANAGKRKVVAIVKLVKGYIWLDQFCC